MKDLKIFTDICEDTARGQIETLMQQPSFSNQKVRIMPDVHAGKGCVVGFTSTIGDSIVPNVVGVDLGCGVLSVGVGKIDPDLAKLDSVIRQYIPSGTGVHDKERRVYTDISELECFRHLENIPRIRQSMGTLGGGNHFIELGKSQDGTCHLVIHTGSRNLGKQVAEYYQNLAARRISDKKGSYQDFIIKWSTLTGEQDQIQKRLEQMKTITLPEETPAGMEALTGQDIEDYLNDATIVQRWAASNRWTISEIIRAHMGWNDVTDLTESIHNYIECGIIRKGAISAESNRKVIIPLNMRDGYILGIGKGNADWNYSAPHGAGRIMSRSQAFKSLNMEDYTASMDGIFSTSVDKSTLDEAPMAYKPMESIISAISDTVEIREIIKPVYNFKASESAKSRR